jgi:hypothetical protein
MGAEQRFGCEISPEGDKLISFIMARALRDGYSEVDFSDALDQLLWVQLASVELETGFESDGLPQPRKSTGCL